MGDWKTSARAFFRPGEQRRRLMMAVLGVVICAASVALFKQAAFGTDPFQSMCNGLNRVIPISFGTLYVLINAVLLVAVLVFDRHYLGVATLINLLAHGADAATVAFSTVCCAIMAAMVIWLHRSNIERLKNGTEYRFGQKK